MYTYKKSNIELVALTASHTIHLEQALQMNQTARSDLSVTASTILQTSSR
jgi:hypothetical protein